MTDFHISLTPQRRNDRLNLEKLGATLWINGELFDPAQFDRSSPLTQWIVGQPRLQDDIWFVTILLPYGSPAPRATRFPDPIHVSLDGPIDLPPYEGPDEEQEDLKRTAAEVVAAHEVGEIKENDKAIIIPERLTLGELPKEVYFSELPEPFREYQEFGAVVAQVICTVSSLELEVWRPAISQHGDGSLLAIRTAYATLQNDDQKRKFVERFAKNTNKALVWETIRWAYNICKPVIEIRNKFAHHIWGACPLIPHALLLVDPVDLQTGQAAHSQLMGQRLAEEEVAVLTKILTGERGTTLAHVDAEAIGKLVLQRLNNSLGREAFDLVFENPLNIYAPAAEVWTANDFRNAAVAASRARARVVDRLQKLSKWLNGLISEDELLPLPKNGK